MRHSPLRHPVAILRQIIGLGQREFGKLVERSSRTIQSIELGKHTLSEDLALRIAIETGVALPWLLDGDPEAKPFVWGVDTIPYTKEHYERTRGLIARGVNPTTLGVAGEEALRQALGEKQFQLHIEQKVNFDGNWLDSFQSDLRSLFAAVAAADRVGREAIAIHRIRGFVEEMKAAFGQVIDEAFLDRYNELLTGCSEGTEDTKALVREDGDTVWSPYLEKDQWKREHLDIVDILLPDKSDAQQFVKAHGRKALEQALVELIEKDAKEGSQRKQRRTAQNTQPSAKVSQTAKPLKSPPKNTGPSAKSSVVK